MFGEIQPWQPSRTRNHLHPSPARNAELLQTLDASDKVAVGACDQTDPNSCDIGDILDRGMLLQFTEQLDNLRVDGATLYGGPPGRGTPTLCGVQNCCQVLSLLDRLNLQGSWIAVSRSGDRDDRFVRVVEQAVTNVNQANAFEAGDKRLSDACGIVSLLDRFRNEHRKPTMLRDKAQRMNQKIRPSARPRRKRDAGVVNGRSCRFPDDRRSWRMGIWLPI